MAQGILLYIDPGTGSMLFTILLGVMGTSVFFIRKLIMKIKFRISGGKIKDTSNEKLSYVIFSDSKQYWRIFKPICDEFERRGVDVSYWTASADDPALIEEYHHVKCEFIGAGNRAYAKLNNMSADICLSSTPGLQVYQWKRSKNVRYYVHILHEAGGTLQYRMFGLDAFDAVLLSGEFQIDEIRAIEKMRGLKPKDLIVVGCPYMDELKKKVEASDKTINNKRTVLLAPTWGSSAILSVYGEKILDALVQTGYRIEVRPHPQSVVSEKSLLERLMQNYPETDDLIWNFDNDNFDSLYRADILITEYSGIVFDYTMVFDKPIIYTKYEFDRAPYDSAWIDGKTWRDEILPELGRPLEADQFKDFKAVIDGVIKSDLYAKGRERARKEAWMYMGHGAEMTVSYLIEKSKDVQSQ